jgi:hypothetical protein
MRIEAATENFGEGSAVLQHAAPSGGQVIAAAFEVVGRLIELDVEVGTAAQRLDDPRRREEVTFMASDFAKALYIQRGASVESANAQLRRRGLYRFNVCGMAKARAVLLWHALAHNLMRMRSLNIAFAA